MSAVKRRVEHIAGAKAGAVLAGTRALVEGPQTLDYWHPSVQLERCKSWRDAGGFLARHAYLDALIAQEQRSGERGQG